VSIGVLTVRLSTDAARAFWEMLGAALERIAPEPVLENVATDHPPSPARSPWGRAREQNASADETRPLVGRSVRSNSSMN